MLAWLLLLVLIAGEVGGITWYLRKEYYPVFFNGWAVLIYSALLAVDLLIAWAVSTLLQPGGSVVLSWFAVLGVALLVVVFAMTLFFRWLVRTDWTDITKL